jgi:hypothetical protein
MTLTYNEIASLLVEINGDGKDFKGLLKQKLSLKAKALIHRLNKIVQDEVKIFDELRLEVFKKHGDEAEGNVTIAPENIAAFQAEFNELLAVEKPIDLSTIWTTKLSLDDVGSIETDEFYPVFLKLIEDEQK